MSDIKVDAESSEASDEHKDAPAAAAISPEGTATVQGVAPQSEVTDRHEGIPQISITSTAAQEVLKEARPSESLSPKTRSAMQGEE